MFKRVRRIMIGLIGFIGLLPASGQELSPPTHPLPTGILGTLYANTAQTGRPATVNTIHQLAGHRNHLFVALTDSAGHEILDVWDTRNLRSPTLISSLDFGALQTNGVMFTPLALVPYADGLLLQIRTGFHLYRFQPDGQLRFDRSLPAPNTGLGLGVTQLHVAGGHASMLQQVIPNQRITAENLNQVHQEVLLDLTDPAQPLFLWAGPDGPSILNSDPLNGRSGGNPASLWFDVNLNQVRLTTFESTREAQQEVFWKPKLEKVFAAAAFQQPLRALLQEALRAANLAELQARGIDVFSRANGPPDTLLSARILEHHASTQPLKEVLTQYGIALDDPLELALAKAIADKLEGDLENRLAREWYAPVLQRWLETLLAPGLRLQTAEQTKAALTAAFNVEIDEQTLARYLTRHVISPLLGNPDFMELKLNTLLDQTCRSPAGQMMDAMLQTAGGFGAVNSLLDSVRGFIDSIPGVDLPSLPACAQFPDTAEKLLDLALFAWNDPGRGVVLNRDGLAWFELLKFYRYLTGHTDFSSYSAEVNERLRAMQQTLGANLASRLSEAFELPGGSEEWAILQAEVAGQRQTRLLLGRLLAHALIESIPDNESITAAMSLRAALAAWGLRVQQPGYPESKVSDLMSALQAHGLGQTTLGEVYHQAAVRPVDLFQAQVGQVLRLQVQASFGLSDLDLPFIELVRPCLDFEVGVQRVMGNWMSGLLGDLLADGPGMSSLLLEYRHAFENHDCIARWLVVLNAIGNASALFGGDAAARALEYALHEAYSAGVGCVIETMFGPLIQATANRGQAAWLAAQLSPRTHQWTLLEPTPNTSTTTLGAFAWQQRVAAVLQQRFETNWFGPRALKLVLCHPDDPQGTRQVYDLGRWQTVNYVNHHQGALYVGGAYFTSTDTASPSGKVLVVDLSTAQPRLQRLTGDAHTALASAPKLAGANHDACLAIGGLNQVYFIPNPAGAAPLSEEPLQPPRFLQPLAAAQVPLGAAHTFRARVSGTAPLTCRWFKDGVLLPDRLQARLEVVASNAAVGGVYSLVISNAAGSVTNSANLAVLAPEALSFVEQPADAGRLLGQSVTFSALAQSSGPVAYQWLHCGLSLAGATRAQLTLTNLTWAEAGSYCVQASQGSALVCSRTATLELIEPGSPVLLQRPADRQPLGLGTPGTLTSAAAGWGDLSWQWYKHGQPIAGATRATLELGEVTTGSIGEYRLEVRDAAGTRTAQSFTVVLVAAANLSGSLNPQGRFTVTVTGGVPGQTYSLQRSADLVHWTDVQTGAIPASGALDYQDTPPAASIPGAYFRLQVTP